LHIAGKNVQGHHDGEEVVSCRWVEEHAGVHDHPQTKGLIGRVFVEKAVVIPGAFIWPLFFVSAQTDRKSKTGAWYTSFSK